MPLPASHTVGDITGIFKKTTLSAALFNLYKYSQASQNQTIEADEVFLAAHLKKQQRFCFVMLIEVNAVTQPAFKTPLHSDTQ